MASHLGTSSRCFNYSYSRESSSVQFSSDRPCTLILKKNITSEGVGWFRITAFTGSRTDTNPHNTTHSHRPRHAVASTFIHDSRVRKALYRTLCMLTVQWNRIRAARTELPSPANCTARSSEAAATAATGTNNI